MHQLMLMKLSVLFEYKHCFPKQLLNTVLIAICLLVFCIFLLGETSISCRSDHRSSKERFPDDDKDAQINLRAIGIYP